MILTLPPYARSLGIEPSRDEHGRLLLSLPFGVHLQGRPGYLHGGAIAGLLEIAAIATLQDRLADDDRPRIKPINVTTSFMRGGQSQTTYAVAVVSRLGKRIANVESFAWQDDEAKPIATARMNLLLARD